MIRLSKKNAHVLIISAIVISLSLVFIRLYQDDQKRQAMLDLQRVREEQLLKEKLISYIDTTANLKFLLVKKFKDDSWDKKMQATYDSKSYDEMVDLIRNERLSFDIYDYRFETVTPKQRVTTSPSLNEQISVRGQEIYDYMEAIWDNYESTYSVDKAEALVLIDASSKFGKPIIEVFRAYTLYTLGQNERTGLNLGDNEIDVVAISRLKVLGFKEVSGRWYYNGKPVNVGTPLSIPESMKPQKPEHGKELIVKLEVTKEFSELKHVRFKGKTNLPTGTILMLRLESPAKGYLAQDRVNVNNGEFISAWFSDADRAENRLASGKYLLVITTPTVNVQDATVKVLLGEQGKNMKGRYIKFDPIWGYRVEHETTFYVP